MSKEKKIPQPESVKKPDVSQKTKKQLPDPKGYRVLVAMPKADETTDGGIIKASSTIRDEEVSNICGYVLELGPDAYADKNKFPNGPWCLKGDWIVFAKYAGSRVKIEGGEIRILNDDEVLAKLKDPKDVLTLY